MAETAFNSSSGYAIQETLHDSLRSVVYRATRTADGRPVILKVLSEEFPPLDRIARLRREFRLTTSAAAEGVVVAYGLLRLNTTFGIVFEDWGGAPLSLRSPSSPSSPSRLDLRQALSLGARIAGALGRIHERRIIHKDINPANLVWNPETDVVKIIDFGIATELAREEQEILNPNVLEGTLLYISPEQTGRMNRSIDYRTDLYSLGVTLYELLTGQPPFLSSDPMEMVHRHIATVPDPVHARAPSVPPVVSAIVARLLAKRPEDRYQSAFSLEADLDRCVDSLVDHGRVADFAIGHGDVSDRLQVSQKLYGRDREVEELLAAFARAAGGDKEMMLVSGYSGIGKSALVHEVHKPIVALRGYFISGKFDQYNRSAPYASLIQAVQELIRQLLTEPAEALARWREEILAAVGPNAQVIIDVIQEVELVIGKRPPVPELPPREAENRFNLAFERFFRALSGPSHPLAIFLDDLQWADLPSLKLIERLMTGAERAHMFLIGAYRDNEVDAGHPLLMTVEEMRRAGAVVRSIALRPLGLDHCVELLMDTLRCGREEALPLADVCLQKTGGNPFFLGQFLLSLRDAGELMFDAHAGCFRWDIQRILSMEMTDNVVELMAAKIKGLPMEAQGALRLAACIGNVFDLQTLSVVLGKPLAFAADALWPGLREGLILPVGDAYKLIRDEIESRALMGAPADGSPLSRVPISADSERVQYRFLHDRVQQAAYSLIPPDLRVELHREVGRQMLWRTADPERDERLFAIVNHLNLGASLLDDRKERDELAQLNLCAGTRAKASAAHSAAFEHFKQGIALLGEGGWERRPDLAVALHLSAAESSYLNKDFDGIDPYAAKVLEHAGQTLNQVKIAEIRIQAFNAQNRLADAVKTALQILKLLGIEFPERPTTADLLVAVEELDRALGGRDIASLIDLPVMTDPAQIAGIRILAMTIPTSYLYDPALFPLMAARQVALSVAHGNTGPSASGYASWGIILVGGLGRIDDGYAFGKLAIKLLDRVSAKDSQARTEYIFYNFIAHAREHVRASVLAFKDVYRTAVETGDLDMAGYSLHSPSTQLFLAGGELSELDRTLQGSIQALVQLKHAPALNYTRALYQLVLNLMGRAEDPCRLVGEAYDEAVTLALHSAAKDSYALGSAYLWKLMLCYLFGRYDEAEENASMVRAHLPGLVGQYQVSSAYLFDALLRLATLPGKTEEARRASLALVDESRAKLELIARHAPMNYAHKYWLVDAERSRVLGRPEEARGSYYRAMALAREHEYRNEEAIATELFAAFLLAQGEQEAAQLFMAKARHLYEVWGAAAKAFALDRRYPTLLAKRRAPTATGRLIATSLTQEIDSTFGELDLFSVLKASQTISGEVVLPELLKKMMHIVLENAGARRGLLIVEGGEPLVVEADRRGGEEQVAIHHAPVEQRGDLALTILRYVRRTHTAVVLGDAAAEDGPFQSDPYVMRERPRSVLCQAIRRQKELVAVLYLENDLAANVFTKARCRVLDLLSAQAAISIENARLYETLDNRVKERTAELSQALADLREAQQRLIMQEKLASLGMITSGIAHEIKNPLNFINNFSKISVGIADELGEAVDQVAAEVDEEVAANIQELVSYLKDSAGKIHQHGKRADDIVRAMLAHSRGGSGERVEVALNPIVTEHVNLAYQGFRLNHPNFTAAIELHLAPDLPALNLAPEEIGRVVQNLTSNACYAIDQKQKQRPAGFSPTLRITTRREGEQIEVRVHDNGQGIPAGIRDKMFTPFFTTKPPGEGTGLGLSISHSIVSRGHGGTLDFTSAEGMFTEFVISLPRETKAGLLGRDVMVPVD